MSPIPIRVTRHPHLPRRYTHTVSRRDALSRDWLTTSALPLGTWPSREAAQRAAKRLERRGIVAIVERAP